MQYSNCVVYPEVMIADGVDVGEFSIIGKPTRSPAHGRPHRESRLRTEIGQHSQIGTHVLIEEGAMIGCNCIVESNSVVENGVCIGDGSFVVHGARICSRSSIGHSCVIGGFIAERSVVGDNCRVLGRLLHRHLDPTLGWDIAIEPAPSLESNVFVAMSAVVIGNVKLANHVYVAAGAIVTRDVPPFSIVHGTNRILPAEMWKGPLSQSNFWRRGDE